LATGESFGSGEIEIVEEKGEGLEGVRE